jgi:hypothetical protein
MARPIEHQPFLRIRDPPELSNPLSALRTSNLLIKMFLGHRTLTECSDFSRALTRHRIGHSGGNIPLIQRDLIEVYAPSRLNYPLRGCHRVAPFVHDAVADDREFFYDSVSQLLWSGEY